MQLHKTISKLHVANNSYQLLNVYYVSGIVLSTQSLSHSIFKSTLCKFNKFQIVGYPRNVVLQKSYLTKNGAKILN